VPHTHGDGPDRSARSGPLLFSVLGDFAYLKYHSPCNYDCAPKARLATKKNPEQSTGLGLGEFVALRLLGRAARCRGMGEPPGRPIKQKYAAGSGRRNTIYAAQLTPVRRAHP
jgi:hypothetical protein